MKNFFLTVALIVAVFCYASLATLVVRIGVITAAPGGVTSDRDSIGVIIFAVIAAAFTTLTINLAKDS